MSHRARSLRGGLSQVHPITSWAPLIVVLTITAVREAMDDLARYRADCEVNARPVEVVRAGRRVTIPCSSITPGTLVVVPKDTAVPCDILLATSGATHGDGRAYVETAALDGESDLKPRSAPQATAASGVEELSLLSGTVDCPLPNSQLYSFDAVLSVDDTAALPPLPTLLTPPHASSMPEQHSASAARLAMKSPHDDESNQIALTLKEGRAGSELTPPRRRDTLGSLCSTTAVSGDSLVQAGTIVRDTPWIAGWAMYTGGDTKSAQSTAGVPSKVSDVEGRVNAMTWMAFRLQLCLVAVFAVTGIIWNSPQWLRAHWYLGYAPDSSPWFDALVLFVRFLLLNSFMIPVSLKVLLDVAKSMYARQVAADSSMASPSGGRAKISNSNCIEDCGIISHVLTDKTGTLTDNVMYFADALVCGVAADSQSKPQLLPRSLHSAGEVEGMFWSALALCNAAHVEHTDMVAPGSEHHPWQWHPAGLGRLLQQNVRAGAAAALGQDAADDEEAPLLQRHDHGDAQVRTATAAAAAAVLAATHLPRRAVSFHSPSPDEEALVHAAACRGIVLCHRDPGPGDSEQVQVQLSGTVADAVAVHAAASGLPAASVAGAARALAVKEAWYAEEGPTQKVHILHSIAFTSTRKRMSVVVQDGGGGGGGAWLLAKGADDVMLPRLDQHPAGSPSVHAFLQRSSLRGLRTLVVAARWLGEEELRRFQAAWAAAHARVHGRQEALDAAASQVEHSLRLLGATAVRDALQAGVPAALASLRGAGVRTWMLTGDKQETALQIARAAQLCRPFVQVLPSEASQWQSSAGLPMLQVATGAAHTVQESLQQLLRFVEMPAVQETGYAVSISGDSVSAALSRQGSARDLQRLLLLSEQVVCSRASPEHKAQLTTLCKDNLHSTRVLAIGDGGNDVPMIQAAHVGVGISGREGEAAARTADAALPMFASLVPLLFFHGRRAHRVTAFMAQFALYKSMLMCSQQILFNAFVAVGAGSSLFDSFSLTAFNTLFTTAPLAVLSVGSDLDAGLAASNPALYKQSLQNRWLTPGSVAKWLAAALAQGITVWIACVQLSVSRDSVQSLAYASFTAVLCTVFVSLAVHSPVQSRLLSAATVCCLGLYVLIIVGRSFSQGEGKAVALYVMSAVWGSGSFVPWLVLLVAVNLMCLSLILAK